MTGGTYPRHLVVPSWPHSILYIIVGLVWSLLVFVDWGT